MNTPLPCPMLPAVVRVARVRRETRDTVTLALDAGPGTHAFLPGQFDMLYLPAVGEVPVSVCGARDDGAIEHTVKAVGAVTTALYRLRRGAAVGLRGPYGQPWPLAAVEGLDLVLVAGGLGLAPLRPVVHHVLAHRGAYGQVTVLVGARTPEDLLYRAELARWSRRRDLRVRATVDRASPAWTGHVGVVPALLDAVPLAAGRTAAFVCGPEVMMRFTVRELLRRGLAGARIHLSLERNMKCAVGFCGHCQLGPHFVCKDGPVLAWDRLGDLLLRSEL